MSSRLTPGLAALVAGLVVASAPALASAQDVGDDATSDAGCPATARVAVEIEVDDSGVDVDVDEQDGDAGDTADDGGDADCAAVDPFASDDGTSPASRVGTITKGRFLNAGRLAVLTPGVVDVVVTLPNGTVAGTAKQKQGKPGTLKMQVKLTPAAAKLLARKRVKLKLKATQRSGGKVTSVVRRTITAGKAAPRKGTARKQRG